ncbi:hypothetical protein MXB_3454, partial [Myxobolus squamalis]
MGIPKFFYWITSRYPSICQKIDSTNTLNYDYFYIDLNSIIHKCTHSELQMEETETEFEKFEKIGSAIESLFNTIKPRKLMVLAVDGVAPCAKMSQQRHRRYRKCVDDIKKETESPIFDSNCISP